MRSLFKLLPLAAALCLGSAAQASVYSVQYQGTSGGLTKIGGDLNSFQVGDTVNFDLIAGAGKSWHAAAGESIWAINFLDECGTRAADFTWEFKEHGAVVSSGAGHQQFSCVHIGPAVSIGFNGIFDEFAWSALLTSSTASGNTSANVGLLSTNAPVVAAVPEPASLALFGLGLAAVVALRRRSKA